MNRRKFFSITGVILSTPIAGCISNSDTTPSENRKEKNSSSGPTSESEFYTFDQLPCTFHVLLVEEPPEDAPLVNVEEEQLGDVTVIERVFEKVSNPNEYEGPTKMRSGEYEQLNIEPESTEEYEEAVEALDSLPRYNNHDYPTGVYLTSKTEDMIAVLAEICLT